MPRVAISKGKANLFLDGNPIVFAGATDSVKGTPKTGDPVIVSDWRGSAIAWGLFNSVSMFRVRIMQLDREVGLGEGWKQREWGGLRAKCGQLLALRNRSLTRQRLTQRLTRLSWGAGPR